MDPTSPPQGKAGPGTSNTNASTGSVERSNSQSSLHRSGHASSHRQSFAENLRQPPPSPRQQRHLSLSQSQVQELLSQPSQGRQSNSRFAGRDWRDVVVGELVAQDDVKWVELETSVEEATMALLRNTPPGIVLVRESPTSKTAVSIFDYNDLNSYLLVVVGLAKPDDEQRSLCDDIANRARERVAIPLRDIQPLCRKETLVSIPAEQNLAQAIEIFGSGIHQILITDQGGAVLGALSQLKVVEFFWNERINFPIIDRLYAATLRDLEIGSQQIVAINGDSHLHEALTLMNNEGLTSVAVVDNGLNVVGNISTADVRHLTSATSLPLLQQSCMHFISVILTERGVEKGRDSFPVFYVNPYSTLMHTVAKLVATQSHRMWIVNSASPSPSAPATPNLGPVKPAATASSISTSGVSNLQPASTADASSGATRDTTVLIPAQGGNTSAPQSPLPSPGFVASVPAAAMPGVHVSGRLTGVVSLTDILNMFAKHSGLNPSDPGEQRARRRRSSSSSLRPSIDSSRASVDGRR